MGLDPLLSASGITVILCVVAGAVVIRFARRRYEEIPGEYRFAVYPTILIALSLVFTIVAGLASLLYAITTQPFYYTLAISMSGVIGLVLVLAALLALEKYWLTIPSVLLFAVGQVATWGTPALEPGSFNFMITMIVNSILNFAPIFLFGYLWWRTRKTTTFGLFTSFLLLGTYGIIRGMLEGLAAHLIWMRLLGLALLIVCFLLYERPVGAEIVGYALSVVVVSAEGVWILMFWDIVLLETLIFTAATAIASSLLLISAVYLWGRYRENPHYSTLLLFLFFALDGIGYIAYIISEFGMLPLRTVTFCLSVLATSCITASAIYAMEWRGATLLPFIFSLPLVTITLLWFPTLAEPTGHSLFPASAIYWSMAGLNILFAIIPVVLYLSLFRGLSPEPGAGRAKALGLAIGLLLMAPAFITAIPVLVRSGVRILSSAVFFLALTGYLDKAIYGEYLAKEGAA